MARDISVAARLAGQVARRLAGALVVMVMVVVTVVTVDMLVFDFFGGRLTYFGDFDRAAQCHAREWVIAIEHDFVAFDVGDGEKLCVVFIFRTFRKTFKHHARFDVSWKQ